MKEEPEISKLERIKLDRTDFSSFKDFRSLYNLLSQIKLNKHSQSQKSASHCRANVVNLKEAELLMMSPCKITYLRSLRSLYAFPLVPPRSQEIKEKSIQSRARSCVKKSVPSQIRKCIHNYHESVSNVSDDAVYR